MTHCKWEIHFFVERAALIGVQKPNGIVPAGPDAAASIAIQVAEALVCRPGRLNALPGRNILIAPIGRLALPFLNDENQAALADDLASRDQLAESIDALKFGSAQSHTTRPMVSPRQ